MPGNIPPRGLFDVESGVWGVPSAVWAVDGTGAWKSGKAVWVWDPDTGTTNGVPGSWQVMWGLAPMDGTSPTVTYSDTPTQTTFAWTPPAAPVTNDGWEVTRNKDGVVVASSGPGTSSAIDASPRPVISTYTIRGKLGATRSTGVTTVSFDLTLVSTITGTIQNANLLTEQVHLVVSEPTLGDPDQYVIAIQDSDNPGFGGVGSPLGPQIIATVAPSSGCTYDHDLSSGGVAGWWIGRRPSYFARSVLSGERAFLGTFDTGANSGVISIPGWVPNSVNILRNGSTVTLQWSPPTRGVDGPYRVEKSSDGTNWTLVTASAQTSTPVSITQAGPAWMRVRNEPVGGASAYVQRGAV